MNDERNPPRRLSTYRRFFHWCRRRLAPVLAITLAATLFLATVVGGPLFWRLTTDLGEASAQRQRQLQMSMYERHRHQAERMLDASDPWGALHVLLGVPPDVRGWEWVYGVSQAHRKARGIGEWDRRHPTALSFDRTGRVMASGYEDGTVRLWDPIAGDYRYELQALPLAVQALAFDAGGRRLLSAGVDGSIQLCDTSTGRELIAFHIPGEGVDTIALSHDSDLIAAAEVHQGFLWDARDGTLLHTFEADSSSIASLAFSPDTSLLAVARRDGGIAMLKIQELGQGEAPVVNSMNSSLALRDIAFCPDGSRLLVWDERAMELWDTSSLERLFQVSPAQVPIRSVAFHSSGPRWAVVSGRLLSIWDAGAGELLESQPVPDYISQLVALSPSHRSLAFGNDHWVGTADVGSPEATTLTTVDSPTYSSYSSDTGFHQRLPLRYNAGGDSIVYADHNALYIRDAASGELTATLSGAQFQHRFQAFSRDGRRFATTVDTEGSVSRRLPGDHHIHPGIEIWDAQRGHKLWHLPPPHYEYGPSSTLVPPWTLAAFSPDGDRLAAANSSGVEVWDLTSGRRLASLLGYVSCSKLAFTPDGKHLVAGGVRLAPLPQDHVAGRVESLPCESPPEENTKQWWNQRNADHKPSVIVRWEWQQDRLRSVTLPGNSLLTAMAVDPVSGDANYLASDHSGRIDWSSAEVSRKEGDFADALKYTYSSDGNRLLLASSQMISIFDARDDSLLDTVNFDGSIGAVEFSPTGRFAVVGPSRADSWLWDLESKQIKMSLPKYTVASGLSNEKLVMLQKNWSSLGGRIDMFSCNEDKVTWSVSGHGLTIKDFDVTSDGARVVSCDQRSVCVWDVAARKMERKIVTERDEVHCVACSVPAKRIFAGIEDRPGGTHTVAVWDLETGAPLRELRGHRDGIEALTVSKDGSMLASGSKDGSVRLWDAHSGRLRHRLAAPGRVHVLAFSPDGQLVAAGCTASGTWGGLGVVKIWDARSGAERLSFAAHGNVRDLAFSPDGRRIVTCGRNVLVPQGLTEATANLAIADEALSRLDGAGYAIEIWDVTTGQHVYQLERGRDAWGVAFSPNGNDLVAAVTDPKTVWPEVPRATQLRLNSRRQWPSALKVWPGSIAGHDHRTLVGLAGSPRRLSLSANGKRLAGCAALARGIVGARPVRGDIAVWDLDTSQIIFSPEVSCIDVAISPNGRLLASAHHGWIGIWDIDGGQRLRTIIEQSIRVQFTPDNRQIVSAGEDDTVRVWDVASGHLTRVFRADMKIVAFTLSRDGTKLAAVSALGRRNESGKDDVDDLSTTLTVWDARTGERLRQVHGFDQLDVPEHFEQNIRQRLDFSPDGSRIALLRYRMNYKKGGEETHEAVVYDWANDEEVFAIPASGSHEVNGIAFSPDGRYVLGALGKGVYIWDARNGQHLQTLYGHYGAVSCVGFTPAGEIISGSDDQMIRVWDFPSLERRPN